ncbi:MAG: aspartate/glutamate racemase family protein [Actinomycetota bacterium]|nr:aspartate/glutamate racemase family protein [Actinomycetota bacterium]MDQ2884379.1 aspartate/glutamate racemase family protein [Actinomycetota bacterium]PZS15211.1 MAG: aspartate racemase [Pseudonocardiales bacterium]
MLTIGLLGGMSWESSAEYYRLLNEETRRRIGGHHCARCVLASLDFAEVVALQRAGAWEEAGAVLADAARGLERAGAQLLVLCTNLMHKVADDVAAAVDIPFLHIADVVGEHARQAGLRRLGLLGARWTMQEDFYRSRLGERFDLEVLIPDEPDRTLVDRVIYDELTQGRVESASRADYRQVISRLTERGVEGVILGCTEITLLIDSNDSHVPLLDSTRLHAHRAVSLALSDGATPASRAG